MRRPWTAGARAITLACALLGRALLACASPEAATARERDGEPPGVAPRAATVVVLPDTQFYACAYPETFERQARWIVEQRDARAIGLALHTGDVVDRDVAPQWEVAAQSLHALDGEVPYLVVPGNHDLSPTRESLFATYFHPRDAEAREVAPVALDPARLDNAYAIVTLAGRRWLFLGLEFGPRDAVVRWASDVLDEHAELPAVLFTHAYLYSDRRRYDRAIEPPQRYHPDLYAVTPDEGINDGEDLWQKLVEPHDNVKLVLSGHVIPDGTARATHVRASGRRVHEVLANYQRCDLCPCAEAQGGGGYLRLLEFDGEGTRVEVSTYSPALDRQLADDENAFSLPLDLD